MGKRIRLGLVYIWKNSWLGGKYYLENLLIALNTLTDEKKPWVNLYCLDDATYKEFQKNTEYPYLEKNIVKIKFRYRVWHKILSVFSWRVSHNVDDFPLLPDDDIFFPLAMGSQPGKMISWVPDLQEKHLQQYFSKKELKARDSNIRHICEHKIPIVFSSNDSQSDFLKYYPGFAKHPTYVVHFAVNQPDFSDVDIITIKNKYGIKKPYLICANQFWQHKNHLFLFEAFKKAQERGLDMQLVCTGKMEDYRRPQYIAEIKRYLCNNLGDSVLTLGVIGKKELLCLMKHSYAVIQPSLFEGWNTTVEDCKAMNKFIFLSDLPVHREQIDKNVCFFDPYDESDLVEKLVTVKPTEEYFDYSCCINQFGEDFCKVLVTKLKRFA